MSNHPNPANSRPRSAPAGRQSFIAKSNGPRKPPSSKCRRLLGRSALNRAERSSGAHDDFAPQLQFELWKVRTGCSSKPYLAEPEAWGRSKKPTPMIVAAPFKL
jgi:hypothetical protein